MAARRQFSACRAACLCRAQAGNRAPGSGRRRCGRVCAPAPRIPGIRSPTTSRREPAATASHKSPRTRSPYTLHASRAEESGVSLRLRWRTVALTAARRLSAHRESGRHGARSQSAFRGQSSSKPLTNIRSKLLGNCQDVSRLVHEAGEEPHSPEHREQHVHHGDRIGVGWSSPRRIASSTIAGRRMPPRAATASSATGRRSAALLSTSKRYDIAVAQVNGTGLANLAQGSRRRRGPSSVRWPGGTPASAAAALPRPAGARAWTRPAGTGRPPGR